MGSVTTIGVQIGQGREPTAIAVAEVERRTAGDNVASHFQIRFLDRMPPGTSYPSVVERLVEIVTGVTTRTGSRPTLNVDATAADPVLDLLREKRLEPVACHFNHGGRRNQIGFREVVIGKGFLVVRLKVLFQTGRLHLANTEESTLLREELLAYELRLDDDADNRLGAFRVGSRDDLVTALGLAVQEDDRGPTCTISWMP
jgi:hypothetical protein